MGLFDHFPYTNVHELNLDWILSMMKALEAEWKAFTAGNSLTFSDPLKHDISKSYAKNTIVLDGNGNAYISLQAVPVGVGLQNRDYWLMVFDYEAFIEKVNKNFTVRYYRDQYRATTAMSIGDWLTIDDLLYKATAAIAVDDVLEIGVNIEHFTLEDFIKAFMLSANQMIRKYKNDIDASELAYRQQLANDIATTTASLQAQLDVIINQTPSGTEVLDARVGFNATTYDTLKDSIINQNSFNTAMIKTFIKNNPTDFFPLLNINWTSGKYIKPTDGTEVTNAAFATSNPITLKANTTYMCVYHSRLYAAYYDLSDVYDSSAGVSNTVADHAIRFNGGNSGRHLRISGDIDYLGTFVIYEISSHRLLQYLKVGSANFMSSEFTKICRLFNGIGCGKNLFSPDLYVNGKYIQKDIYMPKDNTHYIYELINVEPSTDYAVSGTNGDVIISFFDDNDKFISQATSKLFTTPAGTTFLSLSARLTDNNDKPLGSVDRLMLEQNSTVTDFEPYYNKFRFNTDPIIVDINGTGDFTSVTDGVAFAKLISGRSVIIKAGTYNIISETAKPSTSKGVLVGNGVKIFCEEGVKLEANYSGSESNMHTKFSIFTHVGGGFEIHGGYLESSNIRYAIHDDRNTDTTPYKVVIDGVKIKHDNALNPDWHSMQCIGGGFGLHGDVTISNCEFECPNGSAGRGYCVSYHNTSLNNAESTIRLYNNYFKGSDDTFRLSYYGSSTLISKAYVSNNHFAIAPVVTAESGATIVNVELIAWNNNY